MASALLLYGVAAGILVVTAVAATLAVRSSALSVSRSLAAPSTDERSRSGTPASASTLDAGGAEDGAGGR
jgi:hypothetical protein